MNKGSIYKLYNDYGTYYGSTTKTLKERLRRHKNKSKNGTNKCTSKILFQNGCIPKIKLLEEVEFDDIKELRDREAYYIRNLDCVNKVIPNRTQKEWQEVNKEKLKVYCKRYNEANKEKIAQRDKKYREKIAQKNEYYEKKREEEWLNFVKQFNK